MKTCLLSVFLLVSIQAASAQFGGGAITLAERNQTPLQNELQKRATLPPSFGETPDERAATLVEASVLINVRADEYVAVFALNQQEKTVGAADEALTATLAQFQAALTPLGVKDADMFVDFVLQNRVFTYSIDETAKRATEKLVGFEVRKNVSIRFKNKALLTQITSRAAQLGIYDLVKVDYVVQNVPAVQARLQTETARVLQLKLARAALWGAKSLQVTQVIADLPSIYYPTANYSSYQAAQTNSIQLDSRDYITERAVVSGTFYFNPLDGSHFDTVIDPVVVEPVVQFTSYVKVRAHRVP